MPLGIRRAGLALVPLACVVGLTACGGDDPTSDTPADAAPTSASTSVSAEPTTTESTETTEPEPTPTVEPATGVTLKHDLAEITLPKGWVKEDDFGIPFVRQGSDQLFGAVTFSELGGTGNQAMTLDKIAQRQLRLVDLPRVKRLDDVVIGGDTQAYRLAGRESKFYYNEYYGVLIGNFEYTIAFTFQTQFGTIEEAQDLMASVLATFDFNP